MTDAQLRYAYRHCAGAAGNFYEDSGITPLEAGATAEAVIACTRAGGFLDTIQEGKTGMFIEAAHGGAATGSSGGFNPKGLGRRLHP